MPKCLLRCVLSVGARKEIPLALVRTYYMLCYSALVCVYMNGVRAFPSLINGKQGMCLVRTISPRPTSEHSSTVAFQLLRLVYFTSDTKKPEVAEYDRK